MKKKNPKSIFQALLAVTCFLILCISCAKSPEKKTAILLKEYAKANIADYESFEVMELDSVKEKFSDLYDEEKLIEYLNLYHSYVDSIDNMNENIANIDDYLYEQRIYLSNAKAVGRQASYNFFNSLGDFWGMLAADDAVGTASSKVKQIEGEIAEANELRYELQKIVDRCIDSVSMIFQYTENFCHNYEPKTLGHGTVAKCRYRGEDGNMKSVEYEILLNDDITSIISIIDKNLKSKNEEVCSFVDYVLSKQ